MKYFNNIFKRIASGFALGALLLATLSSCSEDMDYNEGIVKQGDEISVTLNFPDYIQTTIGSRAFNNTDKVLLVFYDSSKIYLSQKSATFAVSTDKKSISLTFSKVANAAYVHFIVNGSLTENADPATTILSTPDKDLLWGYAQISSLSSTPSTISLIHPVAKIKVTNSATGFTLSSYCLYGDYNQGYLAPSDWDMSDQNLNIPSLTDSDRNPAPSSDSGFIGTGTDDAAYAFETWNTSHNNTDDKGKVKLIVKGSYGGVSYYYPIAFADRSNGEDKDNDFSEDPDTYDALVYKDIHRNHEYTLNIKYVRAAGWTDLNQAVAAEPDNRIAVEITDKNSNITDIIATRDYALGVQQNIEAAAWNSSDATNGISEYDIEIVSSYPNYNAASGESQVTAQVVSIYSDWLKISGANSSGIGEAKVGSGITANGSADLKDESGSKTGTKYKLTIQVYGQKNENERTGKILVKSGNLSREITVTQAGFDFLNGDLRPVRVETVTQGFLTKEINETNYFNWLGNCKGIKPEDNRNVVRNRGLHFPAVPAYELKYYIPKKTDDQSCSITEGASYFTLDSNSDNSNYIVTAVNTTDPQISIGTLKIIEKDGTHITYQLYKTGYFHKMTSNLSQFALNSVKDGWYYYEIVKVGKTGNYYIMDRNLGATSNAAYKSTFVNTRKNTMAIGGYFKVADQRFPNANNREHQSYDSNVTIIDKYGTGFNSGPATITESGTNFTYSGSGFRLPSQSEISDWGIKAIQVPVDEGETPIVAGLTIKEGFVADNAIYIPHSGYYEDETSFKSEIYANLWTRSLHCYSQSYDSKESAEFGYWYRCLNGYGTGDQIDNISQIRLAQGGYGEALSSYSNYRYMPIRLVWEGGSTSSGGEDKTYDNIYLRTNKKYSWDANESYQFYIITNDSKWRLDNVTLEFGEEFKIGSSNWNLSLKIKDSSGDKAYKIWTDNSPLSLENSGGPNIYYAGPNSQDQNNHSSFNGYLILNKNGNDYSLEMISN